MKLKATILLVAAVALLAQSTVLRAQTTVPRDKIPANISPEVKKEIEALYLPRLQDRFEVIYRLGKMGAKASPAVPFLIGLLHHAERERVFLSGPGFAMEGFVVEAANASKALAKIGKPAIEPLRATLRHENQHVREYGARALGLMGDMDAVKVLMAALKSDSPEARAAASVGLKESRDARVIEPLLVSLGSANAPERSEALATLEAISGEKLGPEPAKWRAWWENEKAKKAEKK